jgi:hypothetical protein
MLPRPHGIPRMRASRRTCWSAWWTSRPHQVGLVAGRMVHLVPSPSSSDNNQDPAKRSRHDDGSFWAAQSAGPWSLRISKEGVDPTAGADAKRPALPPEWDSAMVTSEAKDDDPAGVNWLRTICPAVECQIQDSRVEA